MSYKIGTIKDNNLFVRCPYCGDSEKRDYIAHLSVNIETGLYHCFRCKASGKLSTKEYFALFNTSYTPYLSVESSIVYTNAVDNRYSLLERRMTDTAVEFPMRNIEGIVTGYQYRYPGKHIKTVGKKGYGYVGSKLVSVKTIRIVEGPYDVVYPDDVCVFGSLSFAIRNLKTYNLLLAPDSDIVRERNKLISFVKMLEKCSGLMIEGIEVFPSGEDPGSMYPDRGTFYTLKDFLTLAKRKL